ncbi:MAG: prolipoprotein diacylglyceryl transferase [Leptospiraceae bacterium]|nr:prolipoprotein diacylglyceryl transferase [Leptospiraceae bacterium]MCB1317238.1 prolipoprotein diacylglyceryl transferase [Leptospiraceae bacterium]MCB1322921.1 prolipoprotein diacylglyceryl transferase [Leptospiraceae bacterium]
MLPVIINGQGWEGHFAFGTLVLGYIYQRYNSIRAGYSVGWFNMAWGVAILFGIVFARLFHFLFWETDRFLADPLIFFQGGGGGAAILGGTIGTGFGGWVYSRWTGVNFLHWCESLMAPIAICLAISRLACFLNGDAYGLPTDMPWGVMFSEYSLDFTRHWRELHLQYTLSADPLTFLSQHFYEHYRLNLNDIPLPAALDHLKAQGIYTLADLSRFYPGTITPESMNVLKENGLYPFPVVYPRVHATQLYESLLVLGIFAIIFKYGRADWMRQRQFFVFWFLYGANRFLIEIIRFDRNVAVANLTYAQVISIVLMIFGAGGYVFFTNQWKQKGLPEPVLK